MAISKPLICTTGTSIESYIKWVEEQISSKDYGEVGITFTIQDSKVVHVRKVSIDTEKGPVQLT